MELLVAFAHVVGAVVGIVLFGIAMLAIGAWESERNRKKALEEASVELGVPVRRLDDVDMREPVLRYFSSRVSSERLRNRLSDFCGIIRTGWGWLGNGAQVVAIALVLWRVFVEGVEAAPYMWIVLGIAVFFWISSFVFSVACKLLTGRYPGQASATRKHLAQMLNQ